jgi:hypothetical protein
MTVPGRLLPLAVRQASFGNLCRRAIGSFISVGSVHIDITM